MNVNAYVSSSLKMYSLSHKHKLSTFSSYSAILGYMFVSICNIFQYGFWRPITAFKTGLSFLIEIYIFPFCHHPLNSCFTEVPHSHEYSNLASVKGVEVRAASCGSWQDYFLWKLPAEGLRYSHESNAQVWKYSEICNLIRHDWLVPIRGLPLSEKKRWKRSGWGEVGVGDWGGEGGDGGSALI